jgi:hypothetical protein
VFGVGLYLCGFAHAYTRTREDICAMFFLRPVLPWL